MKGDGTKTTTVQVRREIRPLTQEMERRLRAKESAVESGAMPHWRQASMNDLFVRLHANVNELEGASGIDGTPGSALVALQKAADTANLANLILMRIQTAATNGEPVEARRVPPGEEAPQS